MNQRLLAEIGRTQRLEILNSLKRTQGMSVNQLVAKMKMSYMCIKQHCLTLQRDGYLDTWRRPQRMGRPEMVYRLTRRTHDLFPTDSNQFTFELLKSSHDIYGPNAPEKLLYNVFERKGAGEKEGGPKILECHSPILNLLDRYPIVGRFEQDMFEAVLATRVRREETRNSGLYECAFYFVL